MRRTLALAGFLTIVACGGGGLGSDSFSYPNVKPLQVTFVNATASNAVVWLSSEENEPSTVMAPAAQRIIALVKTWDSASQIRTFTFKAKVPGGPLTTVEMTISGAESQAENFHGFVASWTYDATTNTLRVSTTN
jgi:hypothetical protein